MRIIKIAAQDKISQFLMTPNAKNLVGDYIYAALRLLIDINDVYTKNNNLDIRSICRAKAKTKMNDASIDRIFGQLVYLFEATKLKYMPSNIYRKLLNAMVTKYNIKPIAVNGAEEAVNRIMSGGAKVSIENKRNVFSQLLNKFSQDVSSAAKKNNMTDLANAIMSGGILADPNSLQRYVKIYPATQSMANKANSIASYVMRYPEVGKTNEYYNYIKGQCFDFIGTIDLEKMKSDKQREMIKKDYPSFMSNNASQEYDIPSQMEINVDSAKWLNPWALTMISSILYYMYSNITNYSEENMYLY